jgi:hypothetical protein
MINSKPYIDTTLSSENSVTQRNTLFASDKVRDFVMYTYAHMSLGVLTTAVIAIIMAFTNMTYVLYASMGRLGMFALVAVQIILSFWLYFGIHKMQASTAKLIFYAYSALTGITLSTIFYTFSIKTIGIALLMSAAFFVCLTMFAFTTKLNMLRFGNILMVALIALMVTQFVLYFVAANSMTLRIISAIAILIFAGFTAHDAQLTRRVAEENYDDPQLSQKYSILCALQLYVDFINLFIYMLQLFDTNDDR